MRRILCIWLPNWPIQHVLVAHPAQQHVPTVLTYRDRRRGEVVAACCRQARRHAVHPGMPIAEATALTRCTALNCFPFAPEVYRRTLGQLAKQCGRYSPIVGLEPTRGLPTAVPGMPSAPSSLLIDLVASPATQEHLPTKPRGLAARWGGELALAKQIVQQFSEHGYWTQLGIADTVAAAWGMAHYRLDQSPPSGLEFAFHQRRLIQIINSQQMRHVLPALPVAALRLPTRTLQLLTQLGIEHIGQLQQLPREGLAARLGSSLLHRLDQLYGDAEEVIQCEQASPCFTAAWEAECPTSRRDVVQQVIQHLCQHLSEQLRQRQRGALQLTCRIEHQQPAMELFVNLFRPTTAAHHLWQLLQVQLDDIQVPGHVTGVVLTASATAPLTAWQTSLWSLSSPPTSRLLADFVDRVSNRLGSECITRVSLQAATLPEQAYCMIPLTGTAARDRHSSADHLAKTQAHLAAGQRPLQLLATPQPIQVRCDQGLPKHLMNKQTSQRVARVWGPERIETRWWTGSGIRRDYYRVLSASGSRLWIFHQLHKTTDAPHDWYLHGFF